MTFHPFIYALVDPAEPGHVRYVGMAPSKTTRPYEHARYAQTSDQKSYLYNWIRKLQLEGREYAVLTLEILPIGTPRKFVGFVEVCYIKALRKLGHQLTNVHEGGWGGATTRGRIWTDEEKINMRRIFKGRPLSSAHRAALRHPWTSTRRAAHKFHLKGRKWSEERRAVHTVWNKGLKGAYVTSDETRKKLSNVQLQHYAENPNRGAQHSERMKKHYADLKAGE